MDTGMQRVLVGGDAELKDEAPYWLVWYPEPGSAKVESTAVAGAL
jgi:hypothetical protein